MGVTQQQNTVANARHVNQRSLEKVTTDDLSGGVLSREQFNQFFREVQETTEALNRVRFQAVNSPSGEVPKMGVGERMLRAIPEATRGTLQNPTTGSLEYDCEKIGLPWELSMESVRETIEGEGTATTIMEMFAQQFAVDVEDLGWNGDSTSADPFIGINDGWLKQAELQGSPVYDHADDTATPQPVDNDLWFNMISSLEGKYKRSNNVAFFCALENREAYKKFLTDRSTGAGDAMLMTDQQPSPFSFDIIAPPSFPSDKVMMTDPQNLLYIVERDMNVRMTQEGEEVVARDLYAIYNMISKLDYQIEDANAAVVANNVAPPTVV